jgi:CDP-6-deoxy-D-xylo-4-hexulose-3-dehydrase
MVREADSAALRERYRKEHPDLNPDFIFAFPAYNVRSTEINALIGRKQLKRLDTNNALRTENLKLFLSRLDPAKYRTDFAVAGSCNYAFTLVLKKPDDALMKAVMSALAEAGVEFRRGTAGGGNQTRQPYLKERLGSNSGAAFPQVDHVHFYGVYIGNYPDLEKNRIAELCELLNGVRARD